MNKEKETLDIQRDGRRGIQFPWKLHELLEQTEKNGSSDIISWLPGGKAFKVHKKEEFCNDIMPGFFNSSKYKTFQRSLNLWGFESVVRGPDKGASYHSSFVRGHPELCKRMTRVKIKGAALELSGAKAAVESTPQTSLPSRIAPTVEHPGANRPAISDFLRSKAAGRSSDPGLDIALAQRLSIPQISPLAATGLPPSLLGATLPPSLNAVSLLQTDTRFGAGLLSGPSVVPSSSTSRLLSAINAAAAALDVIRQEEAELLRRAQV